MDADQIKYYAEVERNLEECLPLVRELVPQEVRWFSEYVQAGEYGLAIEIVAEALPELERSESVELLARRLKWAARSMELGDEAQQALSRFTS